MPKLPAPEILPGIPSRRKPTTVTRAEYVLMTWTAWTCFYGIYDTWTEIPELRQTVDQQINAQSQGQFSLAISTETIIQWALGFYVLTAVVSVFFIYMIAKGKPWARSSAFWGFVAEAVCSAIWILAAIAFGSPPSLKDWLAYIPDYGLQAYALYLLYALPSERWFSPIKDQMKV